MQSLKKLFAAFLLSLTALAQSTKIPIATDCTNNEHDSVGVELCTAIRDTVATSPRYREINNNPKGYEVDLTTIAISENVDTAVSIVLVWHGYYVTQSVLRCGTNVVHKCALQAVSIVDEGIRKLDKDAARVKPD